MLLGGEIQPRENLLLKPREAELNLFDDQLERVFNAKKQKNPRKLPASIIPEKN